MQAEGFSRSICSDDGIRYHLPTAEYDCEAYMTIEAIRESASRAAAKTGKLYAVLVTEAPRRAWIGLYPVQAWAPVR